MNSLPRRSAAETVPVARLAWIAGALATAAQPGRVAIGFLAAVLLWVPGLAWDRAAGPTVDPPGLLAEPWDDVERDEAQRTLRRMAAINVPEIDFEGAILPAEDLAAVLEARADELGLDPQAERVRAAARRAATLAPLGAFNMLLSDGRALYVFCNKALHYIERRAPFGRATLVDEDLQMDFAKVTTPDDRVVVIASSPLTRDETWLSLPLGRLSVALDGRILRPLNRRAAR